MLYNVFLSEKAIIMSSISFGYHTGRMSTDIFIAK